MNRIITLKNSNVPSKKPTVNDLILGEVAINTYDGKIFSKKDNGTTSIFELSTTGHTHKISDITNLQLELDSKIPLSQKAVANGVATLDTNGLIPNKQLPPLAITITRIANSQAEQLALVAEEGDVCIRTDENKSYIHNSGTAGNMTDWNELLTPTDAITSVNGKVGVVNLNSDDISEGSTNLYYKDIRATNAVGGIKNDVGTGANDLWSAQKINKVINNHNSIHTDTVNPNQNNDKGTGYFIGQIWINTSSDRQFICVDDSSASAIWKKISFTTDNIDGGVY